MPNMSYCMFYNTLQDLKQVQEEGEWYSDDLDDGEKDARQDLLNLCREIAECNFEWEK